MQAKITQSVVQNIAPQEKVFRVYDTLLKGFVLVVRPTGKKTWYVDYRKPNGKRTDHFIGAATLFPVAEAREIAREFLAAIARGEDPTEPKDVFSFGKFIDEIYSPWVVENRKTGKETVEMIRASFSFIFESPIENITVGQIEQWRTNRKKQDGVKSSSLNRNTAALLSSLNWAVKRGIIENNPISKLERLPERDSVKKVRYLTENERARLMHAIDEREKEIRRGRESYNNWCRERGLATLPSLEKRAFADYLKPLLNLCLNTGIRRNSVLSLEWRDIDFAEETIMVRAETSKNDKQYIVPMNDLTRDILKQWQAQCENTSARGLVFPSPKTGKKMGNCNSSWEALLKKAEIENFRWHDMRHDFASQLVMKGVDLNTVRELLGHADLKMTLRYAHLAPEAKKKAVQLL